MRTLVALSFLVLSTTAQADQITSQEWTSFASATGQNAPTDADNANGDPYLQASSNAILTGSGFLYSFAAPLTVEVYVPNFDLGADYLTNLTLTIGVVPDAMPLDADSVSVTPFGGSAIAASSFSEDNAVWTFDWSLPSNAASYLFSFSGGPHMPVDWVRVTTSASSAVPVPEPTAIASLLVGMAGLGLVAARRRKASAASA